MKIKNTFFYLLILFCIATACKSDKKSDEKINVTSNEKIEKESTETQVDATGQYLVDGKSSVINWVGSKPGGKHNGEIIIEDGEINFKDGKLKSAKFVADMKSLKVNDLEGKDKNDLENHLKGTSEGVEDHFFNVKKYPESIFKIKSIEPVEDVYKIYGELTIKDITNAIEFNAHMRFSKDKDAVKLISDPFEIDRTKWGIEYKSKSIFDDLKERFIYDEIQLQVNLKAYKQ